MKSSAPPQDAPEAKSTAAAKSTLQQAQFQAHAPPTEEAVASSNAPLEQPAAAAVHGLSADKLSGKRTLRKLPRGVLLACNSLIHASFCFLFFFHVSFCCTALRLGFARAKRYGGAIPGAGSALRQRPWGLRHISGPCDHVARHGPIIQANNDDTI